MVQPVIIHCSIYAIIQDHWIFYCWTSNWLRLWSKLECSAPHTNRRLGARTQCEWLYDYARCFLWNVCWVSLLDIFFSSHSSPHRVSSGIRMSFERISGGHSMKMGRTDCDMATMLLFSSWNRMPLAHAYMRSSIAHARGCDRCWSTVQRMHRAKCDAWLCRPSRCICMPAVTEQQSATSAAAVA